MKKQLFNNFFYIHVLTELCIILSNLFDLFIFNYSKQLKIIVYEIVLLKNQCKQFITKYTMYKTTYFMTF